MNTKKNYEQSPIGVKAAAMSFEEIGEALGITTAGAWMLYRSAIRKLRQRIEQNTETGQLLIDMRDSLRARDERP